jgi:hypothetical protein
MSKLLLNLFLLAALAGCASTPPSVPVEQPVRQAPLLAAAAEVEQNWLKDAPSGALNDAVQQSNIATTICVPGWTATVRPSTTYTDGVKRKLVRGRGLPADQASLYELDHFVPLALGGSPRSLDNLWLQPWDGQWGARIKDRLERKLQLLMCRGTITLQEARDAIRTNWIKAFKQFVTGEDLARAMEPAD